MLWNSLYDYPAWRSLAESLRELAALLRRAGRGEDSAARELADQIDLLMLDPATAAALLPADYRMEFVLSKGKPEIHGDWEMEAQLSAWLLELTRHVADVPVLLEAPESAAALGQALTSELPRTWAARLAVPLFHLRQMVRGARPTAGFAPPGRPAAGAGATGLSHVVPDGEVYHVVLSSPAQELPARRELLWLIMRDLGLDAARLHLCLLAAPGGATADEVCEALGLSGRRGAMTERAYAALARLRQVRLSLLTWARAEGALAWERRSVPLWEVSVREYGQACLDERSGALAAHGRQWSFHPSPESWALAPDLAPNSRFLLDDLRGRRDGLSLAMAVRLSMAVEATATVPHAAILAVAGNIDEVRLRQRLRTAARLQRSAGWEPDFSAWPASDGELPGAATLFHKRIDQLPGD